MLKSLLLFTLLFMSTHTTVSGQCTTGVSTAYNDEVTYTSCDAIYSVACAGNEITSAEDCFALRDGTSMEYDYSTLPEAAQLANPKGCMILNIGDSNPQIAWNPGGTDFNGNHPSDSDKDWSCDWKSNIASDTKCLCGAPIPKCDSHTCTVNGNQLIAAAGATNCVGDCDDTQCCEATICTINQYVQAHVCTNCANAEINDAGDDATGVDTSCTPLTGCELKKWQLQNSLEDTACTS